MMAVLTVVAVFTGINGIINSLSIIVPFLLTYAVGVGIESVTIVPSGVNAMVSPVSTSIFSGNWFQSALLYVSYNIVTAIAVLSPQGSKAKDRGSLYTGAVLGAWGLGCVLFVLLAGIFATSSGNLYGFAARVFGIEGPKWGDGDSS